MARVTLRSAALTSPLTVAKVMTMSTSLQTTASDVKAYKLAAEVGSVAAGVSLADLLRHILAQ